MRGKKLTIAIFVLILISQAYWSWADFTYHSEALLDLLSRTIDPTHDGSGSALVFKTDIDIEELNDIIAGMSSAGTANPTITFFDSDAPGADKTIATIEGQYTSGADGAENGALVLKTIQNGTLITMSLGGAEGTGAFNLADGESQEVTRMTFIAGEDLAWMVPCSFRYDSGDARTEVVKYVGDTTDTNNDIYPYVGVNIAACTAGNACTIWVGSGLLARRDESAPASTDIGAALYTLGTAGAIGTTSQSTAGDHNEMVGVYASANGYDGVTGDYVLYLKSPYMNVVP